MNKSLWNNYLGNGHHHSPPHSLVFHNHVIYPGTLGSESNSYVSNNHLCGTREKKMDMRDITKEELIMKEEPSVLPDFKDRRGLGEI